MLRMDMGALSKLVAGREAEMFAGDFSTHLDAMRGEVEGRTVCVIGAGGTIGRATAEVLLGLKPKRTLLVDVSENNLVEVTRRLRNCYSSNAPDFEAWPMDFTGPSFTALMAKEQPEIILNFAAFKHVRSEKDALTLAEMLRVNVFGNLKLMDRARKSGNVHRVFSISTDKAACPANCMGASKKLMEQVLFAQGAGDPPAKFVTSTRFANVLFSDGSLPASFLQRLEQGQPLAGPSDITRYFITMREAGMLCLLAAFHNVSHELLVPKMGQAQLVDFMQIAERLLESRGFEPKYYGEDTAAAFANLESDTKQGKWPCLFMPAATSGEKPFEEFTTEAEKQSRLQPYSDALAISVADCDEWGELQHRLGQKMLSLADSHWLEQATKAEVVEWLCGVVPTFSHLETGESLDRAI